MHPSEIQNHLFTYARLYIDHSFQKWERLKTNKLGQFFQIEKNLFCRFYVTLDIILLFCLVGNGEIFSGKLPIMHVVISLQTCRHVIK